MDTSEDDDVSGNGGDKAHTTIDRSPQTRPYAADLESIQAARERIKSHAIVTPIMTSTSIDGEAGRELYFKCEIFQKMGAFKFRGACNAILSLTPEEAQKGVVTHSSGNHAAALALAASLRGIDSHIVMPHNTPACKVDNVRRYQAMREGGGSGGGGGGGGGRSGIYFCDNNVESRIRVAAEVGEATGAVFVHPFNDGRVMSGQGTIALEFLEQVPNLDAIIVPISGGGMISGVALAAKALNPSIKIFAAEPKGNDSTWQSKRLGKLEKGSNPKTMADGLRASMGSLTWPIVRDLVEDVILVEEREIVAAMKMCFERLKVVVEPSGAVGLAAALAQEFKGSDKWAECRHVGVILCGGNVDLGVLWKALEAQC